MRTLVVVGAWIVLVLLAAASIAVVIAVAHGQSTVVPVAPIDVRTRRAGRAANSFAAGVVSACLAPQLTQSECARWKRIAERAQFAAHTAAVQLRDGDMQGAEESLFSAAVLADQYETQTPHAGSPPRQAPWWEIGAPAPEFDWRGNLP